MIKKYNGLLLSLGNLIFQFLGIVSCIIVLIYVFIGLFGNRDFLLLKMNFYHKLESVALKMWPLTTLFISIKFLKLRQPFQFILIMTSSTFLVWLFLRARSFNDTYVGFINTLSYDTLIQLIIFSFFAFPLIFLLYLTIRKKIALKLFLIRFLLFVSPFFTLLFIILSMLTIINNKLILPNLSPLDLTEGKNTEIFKKTTLIVGTSATDFMSCYLKEHKNILMWTLTHLLGKAWVIKLNHDLNYYDSPLCTVILINSRKVEIDDIRSLNGRAVLAENLIYRKYFHVIKEYRGISSRIEYIDSSRHPGSYNKYTDKVVINTKAASNFYGQIPLSLFIHEELHGLSSEGIGPISGLPRSGLEEAITSYIESDLIRDLDSRIYDPSYNYQQKALLKLFTYIDKNKIISVYFNGSLYDMTKEIDSKTYPGAFCSYNYYLDLSTEMYLDRFDLIKSKELAAQAEESLINKDLSRGNRCYPF